MESTDAGLTKTLLSDKRAAVVSVLGRGTLSNHEAAVKSSIFNQEGTHSRNLPVNISLYPCLTELPQRK